MPLRWLRRAFPALALALTAGALAACAPAASGPRPTATPTATAGPAPTTPPVGTAVGQRTPDVALTTLDGGALTTEALVAQGRPFLLFFFATW